ncbi:hypothetical protein CsSME_00023876 [Camellia sinensis var. sinensis]
MKSWIGFVCARTLGKVLTISSSIVRWILSWELVVLCFWSRLGYALFSDRSSLFFELLSCDVPEEVVADNYAKCFADQIVCHTLLFALNVPLVGSCELLFYPRYHLDQSSLLCRKPLLAKPMVMDLTGELTPSSTLDLHLTGQLTPSSTLDLQLSTLRDLSIMTAKSHLAAMHFIPDQLSREDFSTNHVSSPSDFLARKPVRCKIQRMSWKISNDL